MVNDEKAQFKLVSPFAPTGDQPQAIEKLTEGVLDGIFNISTLVPAIGFVLLALILRFWYPLNRDRVRENVEILRKKHEE